MSPTNKNIEQRIIRFFSEKGYKVEVPEPDFKYGAPNLILTKNGKKYVVKLVKRIYSSNQLFSVAISLYKYQLRYGAEYSFIVTLSKLGAGFLKMVRNLGIGYVLVSPRSIQIILEPTENKFFADTAKYYYDPLSEALQKSVSKKDIFKMIDRIIEDSALRYALDIKIMEEALPSDRKIVSDVLLKELKEMPNFLYSDEIEFFIDKLKSKEELINITMQTLKKLWEKHKKDEVYRICENFKEFEPILFKDISYRDHFIHQFQVFLLGCPIINHHIEAIRDSLEARIRGNYDDDHIYFTWLIASSLHDIGYPIERLPKWLDAFFKDYLKVDDLPLSVDFGHMLTKRNFMEYMDKLSSLLHHLSKNSGGKWTYDNALEIDNNLRKFFVDQLIRQRNHGVISALCLMDVIENGEYAISNSNYKRDIFSSYVCPAALATLLHDSDIFGDESIKKIEFNKNPLSFLLIYCDTVQEWGRPSKHKSYATDDFEPYLTDLKIDDENIFAELTYYSKELKSKYEYKCEEVRKVFDKIKSRSPLFSIKIKFPDKAAVTYDSYPS